MRIRWWQSIRWRLALGSVLLSLLATGLLALTAMSAIIYYYGADQQNRMEALASARAQSLGIAFENEGNLVRAVKVVIPATSGQNPQSQYVLIVLNRSGGLIYPRFSKMDSKNAVISYLLELTPTVRQDSFSKLTVAMKKGLHGTATRGNFGQRGPFGTSQPFVVQPIFSGGLSNEPVVGAIIIVPHSEGFPSFISTVGGTLLVASLVIAALAALIAILFSRTITHPLTKLTGAAHVLGSGNYSAQVTTKAPGELGELAHTFNEMAAQLNRDVEELRQQELWRRELIMSITHDLATPLTAIAGLGESLVDGVNRSRDDYDATGRIIVRETLRLRRLVKDLHVMAKVEAGALHPQCKDVRLAALVDEVLAVLAPEFERLQVEPRNSIAYNLPAVHVDADMLTRVFSNLCDNALRHTPSGGIVTIEAIERNNMLAVSVTDTGEGIPPEALARVFERFFRADSARQSATGGSGLGLAIVRAIIEAHSGTVQAENAAKAGARIIFTLPLPTERNALPNETSRTLADETTLRLFRKALRAAHLKKLEVRKS